MRSLWWTLVGLAALDAVGKSIDAVALMNSEPSRGTAIIIKAVVYVLIGFGFNAFFVSRINEHRRWPLVVLIVLSVLFTPLGALWAITANEQGQVLYQGTAFPVAPSWLASATALLGACSFIWHYRLYKRTLWADKYRPERS